MWGLSQSQHREFLERIAATAIANQAILKCQAVGLPLTTDNVILFVGDFLDPEDGEFASLIERIEQAVEYVVEKPWTFFEGPKSPS